MKKTFSSLHHSNDFDTMTAEEKLGFINSGFSFTLGNVEHQGHI